MKNLFVYGTLCHLPLLEIVLGNASFEVQTASLADHTLHWALRDGEDPSFPMICAQPGVRAEGLLLSNLSDQAFSRLTYYEGAFGYEVTEMRVDGPDGEVTAEVFVPEQGIWLPGAPWSLQDWVMDWRDITLLAAEEVMSYLGHLSPQQVAGCLPMIQMRAATKGRARAVASPAELRSARRSSEIKVHSKTTPYVNYFAVEEHNLSFPRFDGAMSPVVNRAAFLGGDAVTVLPYDPQRDSVLIVEQFRVGPYMRGDQLPWHLEPIAGRIDPGETPENTARREALEEANLSIGALEHVGNYYPSPGAVTEYLYSYVALCDLPETVAGLGGMLGEAEDIRSHVIPFARLMELVQSGEADNAPLLISAYWLSQNRERLRGAS